MSTIRSYFGACIGGVLLLPILTSPALADDIATAPVLGFGVREAPLDRAIEQIPLARDSSQEVSQLRSTALPSQASALPPYAWPLATDIGDGYVIVNYVDHDPTAGILDYMGGPWASPNHNGTDLTLLNFHQMDKGVPILAAAPGTVEVRVDGFPDRNTDFSNPNANYLLIDGGDGLHPFYYHLRRNSTFVHVGETVTTGEVLGLVGSSGYSTAAHLHFEPDTVISGGYWARDPWTGPKNLLPSLWQTQKPYVGNNELKIMDMGLSTEPAMGGNVDNCPQSLYEERLSQPVVFGIGERVMPFWIQLQGQAGNTYTLSIYNSRSQLFGIVSYPLPAQARYAYHLWYWGAANTLTAADTGLWHATLAFGGSVVRQIDFRVGLQTKFAPRLAPAGRTMLIDGTPRSDTLRVSPLGAPVSYSLLSTMAGVSLADSIVSFPAISSQPARVASFQVLATDAAGLQDTMWYEMVDHSKPIVPILAVPAPSAPAVLAFSVDSANPFVDGVELRYVLPAEGLVRVEIFDVMGRRVRMLRRGGETAGEHRLTWDARGENGSTVPNGLYLCRLSTGGEIRVRRLVRL